MDETGERKLSMMLTSQTVQAQVEVRGWEEAAHRVGSLLVNASSIEPGYVDSMKRVLHEMGPYAVIAPGIVLLHARPEDGVREPCMGLLTLSTPVNFGHSENDPVDIVLALGAVDKQGHIRALQQMAELLGDPEALWRLRSAQDDAALLAVIQSWGAT